MPLHIPQLFLEEPETYLAGAFSLSAVCTRENEPGYRAIYSHLSSNLFSCSKLVKVPSVELIRVV